MDHKAVMQVETLSATTRLVASALAIQFANDKTGQINPSQETITDYLKVHPDTVKRALRELRKAGWLTSLSDGGRGKSPKLRLLSPSTTLPFRPSKGGENTSCNTPEREENLSPQAAKSGEKSSPRIISRDLGIRPVFQHDITDFRLGFQ